MKEEQINKAFLMAGIITQSLCNEPTANETALLQDWTQESSDNLVLWAELNDPDNLCQQLVDYRKYEAVTGLARLRLRLFGFQ